MHIKAEFNNSDWNEVLQPENNDANLSFGRFYNSFEKLLDKYIPLKKISKKDFKRKYKPWITQGILKCIARRD